jgi:hypothetical protein
MQPLSRAEAGVLASAYELRRQQVDDDVATLQQWSGSDAELLVYMQDRHGWTVVSEYAPHYVMDLREALQRLARNGTS